MNVENHFQNIENAIAFINKEEFKDLRRKTDRAKYVTTHSLLYQIEFSVHKVKFCEFRWLSHPSVVEAFYEAEYNSISKAKSKFTSPFYH